MDMTLTPLINTLSHLTNLLQQLDNPGTIRDTPRPDDLQGDYDGWFDGGAFEDLTGHRTYFFKDGSEITIGSFYKIAMTIRLPNGAELDLTERGDKKLAREILNAQTPRLGRACPGCGQAVPPEITHTIVDGVAYHLQCAPRSE
jgi:hypothetical protein